MLLRPGLPSLVRRRSVVLFLTGEGVSILGDGIEQVALLWLTLRLTNSGAAVGMILAILSLPTLLLAFGGGVLVDRLELRRLLSLTEGCRAVTALSLGLMAWWTTPSLSVLALYALLMGVGRALFAPAREVLLVGLVPREDLPALNGLVASNRQIAQLAGPALGGIIVSAVGYSAAFTLDAGTFIISLITIRLLKVAIREPRNENHSILQEMVEAIGYLRGAGEIWRLALLFSLLNFFLAAANAVIPQYVDQRLGGQVESYGLIASFLAGGLLLGSLLNGKLGKTDFFHSSRGRLVLLATVVLGLATMGLGFSVALPLVLAFSLMRGLAVATANANSLIVFQTHVPPAVRGRVFGLLMTAGAAFAPLGYGAGGFLGQGLGGGEILMVIGFLVVVGTAVAALSSPLRRLQTMSAG